MDERLLIRMRAHREKLRTAFDDPRISPERRWLGERIVAQVQESRADGAALGLDFVLWSFHVAASEEDGLTRQAAISTVMDCVMAVFGPESVLAMLADAVWRLHEHGDHGDELAGDKAMYKIEKLFAGLADGRKKP